jgi:hypothetical protein
MWERICHAAKLLEVAYHSQHLKAALRPRKLLFSWGILSQKVCNSSPIFREISALGSKLMKKVTNF